MVDEEILKTAILTFGSIVVAIIAAVGTKTTIDRRKRARATDVEEDEREAVEKYAADPGQFVRDVLRSNDQLTKRVEAAELKVETLQKTIDAFREKDRKFRNALARWFVDIMAAFEQHHIDMPYPRAGDEELLSDVIPSALEATRDRPTRFDPKP
jgi:hypothetical protein